MFLVETGPDDDRRSVLLFVFALLPSLLPELTFSVCRHAERRVSWAYRICTVYNTWYRMKPWCQIPVYWQRTLAGSISSYWQCLPGNWYHPGRKRKDRFVLIFRTRTVVHNTKTTP